MDLKDEFKAFLSFILLFIKSNTMQRISMNVILEWESLHFQLMNFEG